jgi:hypothetical protein
MRGENLHLSWPLPTGALCGAAAFFIKPRRSWVLSGDAGMAEHGAVEIGTATGVDYNDHLGSYRLFLGMTKWVTIGIVILLILMAFFLL